MRKLGENDPGRYEIRILIGPCTLDQAEKAMIEAENVIHDIDGQLGAAASLTTWEESE